MQTAAFPAYGYGRLTVDGNGDALAQDVAILALESWDLAELVDLPVVVADFARLGVHQLEVEAVGLGNSENGGGAWVALRVEGVSAQVSPYAASYRCLGGGGFVGGHTS